MIKQFKNVQFDTTTCIVKIYDSNKQWPHCNTTTHVNELSVNEVAHLSADEVVYMLGFATRSRSTNVDMILKHAQKRKWLTDLYHDLIEMYSLDSRVYVDDGDYAYALSLKEYSYRFHYNIHYILYKRHDRLAVSRDFTYHNVMNDKQEQFKQRKSAWESLLKPRVSWEAFKRILNNSPSIDAAIKRANHIRTKTKNRS